MVTCKIIIINSFNQLIYVLKQRCVLSDTGAVVHGKVKLKCCAVKDMFFCCSILSNYLSSNISHNKTDISYGLVLQSAT